MLYTAHGMHMEYSTQKCTHVQASRQTICFTDVHTLHVWWRRLLGLLGTCCYSVSPVGRSASQLRSAAVISVVGIDKYVACRGYYETLCNGFEPGYCTTSGTTVRCVIHCAIPSSRMFHLHRVSKRCHLNVIINMNPSSSSTLFNFNLSRISYLSATFYCWSPYELNALKRTTTNLTCERWESKYDRAVSWEITTATKTSTATADNFNCSNSNKNTNNDYHKSEPWSYLPSRWNVNM